MADGWSENGVMSGLRAGESAHDHDLNDAAYLEWIRFAAENDLLEIHPEASCKTGVTRAQKTIVKLQKQKKSRQYFLIFERKCMQAVPLPMH